MRQIWSVEASLRTSNLMPLRGLSLIAQIDKSVFYHPSIHR